MSKVYYVEGVGYVSANSKKAIKEYFNLNSTSLIKKVEDIDYNENSVISLDYLIQKDRAIEDMIEYSIFFNEPTRFFKIGEKIHFIRGHFENFTVKDILENGKVIYTENDKGEFRVSPWHEVLKGDKESEKTHYIDNSGLKLNFSHINIESLIHKYYFSGINMNPSYQRGLVWTQEQKEDLMKSIFERIDIGKFVLVELPYKKNSPGYEILDGKQRLSTIIEFVEDRFSYRGVYYSQLHQLERRQLFNFGTLVAQVDSRKLNDKLILEYFVRLNTTGTPMDKKFLNDLKKKCFIEP